MKSLQTHFSLPAYDMFVTVLKAYKQKKAVRFARVMVSNICSLKHTVTVFSRCVFFASVQQIDVHRTFACKHVIKKKPLVADDGIKHLVSCSLYNETTQEVTVALGSACHHSLVPVFLAFEGAHFLFTLIRLSKNIGIWGTSLLRWIQKGCLVYCCGAFITAQLFDVL